MVLPALLPFLLLCSFSEADDLPSRIRGTLQSIADEEGEDLQLRLVGQGLL